MRTISCTTTCRIVSGRLALAIWGASRGINMTSALWTNVTSWIEGGRFTARFALVVMTVVVALLIMRCCCCAIGTLAVAWIKPCQHLHFNTLFWAVNVLRYPLALAADVFGLNISTTLDPASNTLFIHHARRSLLHRRLDWAGGGVPPVRGKIRQVMRPMAPSAGVVILLMAFISTHRAAGGR